MTNEQADVPGGFDLAAHGTFADGVPHELFARLRREAPVLFAPHGTDRADGFWVLTRHADIAIAAADPELSAEGGGGRAGGGTHLEDLPWGQPTGVVLFMMDDPRHEQIKRWLHPFLNGQVIAAMEPALQAAASELVRRTAASGRADVVNAIAEPFALETICTVLGVPQEDRPQLAVWARNALGFTNRRTGRADDGSRATFDAMREYFIQFVIDKRRHLAHDLGSAIAAGEIGGNCPLSIAEQNMHALVLFVSGFEQPRNTIASAILAFAEHPDQWRALQADRSLLAGAIEEILRWAPPNPYNRRTATRGMSLHGRHILAGDKVTFWWPSANRDPAVFPYPDVFDIRRNPNPHMAFGSGIHACSAAGLGRAQLRLVLTELLGQVAQLRLAGPVRYAPNNKHTVLLDVPVDFVI